MSFRGPLRISIGIAVLGQALLLGTYYLATCGAMSSVTGSWIEPPCDLPRAAVAGARDALPAVIAAEALYRPGSDVVEAIDLTSVAFGTEELRVPVPVAVGYIGLSIAVLNGVLWAAVVHVPMRAMAWCGRGEMPGR